MLTIGKYMIKMHKKKIHLLFPLFWAKNSFLILYIIKIISLCGAAGGLWVTSTSPVRAMEEGGDQKRKYEDISQGDNSVSARRVKAKGSDPEPQNNFAEVKARYFDPLTENKTEELFREIAWRHGHTRASYVRPEHPFARLLWNITPLSNRVISLFELMNQIGNLRYNDENVVKILEVQKIDNFIDRYHNILEDQSSVAIKSGHTGAHVSLTKNTQYSVVIKIISPREEGFKELCNSLNALRLIPKELNVTRPYDAAYYPKGSLSIWIEGAEGNSIGYFLSGKNAENAIISSAKYLAKLHMGDINLIDNKNWEVSQKFIENLRKTESKLFNNVLGKEEKNPLFPLETQKKVPISGEEITSENIKFYLPEEEQQKYQKLSEMIQRNFSKNIKTLSHFLSDKENNEAFCFATRLLHRDAHIGNIFFTDFQEDNTDRKTFHIPMDSSDRITIIDYASMMENDPDTQEVPIEPLGLDGGRYLGSLWEWAAQQGDITQEMKEKVLKWERLFFQSYLEEVEKKCIFTRPNQEIFARIFKEDCEAYRLKFYRLIFNSKQPKEIKLRILKSFIDVNFEENPQ